MSKRTPIFKQKAYLSAVAIFEILNHYSRCEQDELVMGVLLGSANQIKSTIPLVATLDEGNIIIDRDLMSERLTLEEEISTNQILGWYTFGDGDWKAQVHSEIEEECLDECLLLNIDMEKLSTSKKFPIDCFLGVGYGVLDGEQELAFVKIPLEMQHDSSAQAGCNT
jgi:JAB1/Mov34/MPN/PAD-1 ubiquitin protease